MNTFSTFDDLWLYTVVFARFVVFFLFFPGISKTVNGQIRLLLAVGFSVCFAPFLMERYIKNLPNASILALLNEGLLGLFLGVFSRILLEIFESIGALISHETGLSNVFTALSKEEGQMPIISTFLNLCLVTFFFVSDMHHLLIQGIVGSYGYFPVGSLLPFHDMPEAILQTLVNGFKVAMQLCAPFLVVGILCNALMGVFNRLIPQVQVFFITQPLEILVGLTLLMIILPNLLYGAAQEMSHLFSSLGGDK